MRQRARLGEPDLAVASHAKNYSVSQEDGWNVILHD